MPPTLNERRALLCEATFYQLTGLMDQLREDGGDGELAVMARKSLPVYIEAVDKHRTDNDDIVSNAVKIVQTIVECAAEHGVRRWNAPSQSFPSPLPTVPPLPPSRCGTLPST